jgi:serine/threonine-protein kinase
LEPSISPAPPGYPRRFGNYWLLAPIAQGGMGDVFLASTLGHAGAVRLVVIKTLREELASDQSYVNRFLDEARIVIQLQHPSICQVFEVGYVDGTHFFVMEHILGTNLKRMMLALGRAGKVLPVPHALYIAVQMLEALDAAHRHKHALTGQPLRVVHRDISPQNVMVSLEGDVKVIDFGLAASELKVEQTESKVVLGKIAYMSPEQARDAPVDAASDQYSAAVVLYEMLSGSRFYGVRTQPEIWQLAGKGFLPDDIISLDPALQSILRRALAAAPSSRYASCGAMADALLAHLASMGADAAAGRNSLAVFVGEAAKNELENSEKTVRALSDLALKLVPGIASPSTPESDTNATAVSARAPAPRSRGTLIVASSSVALAAAIAIVAVVALRTPSPPPSPPPSIALAPNPPPLATPTPSPSSSPPATPSSAPAPSPAMPSPTTPSIAPPSAPSPSTPEAAGDAQAVSAPSKPSDVVAVSKVKRAPKKEPWASWSQEKKLAAVDGCASASKMCTTIATLRQRGEKVLDVSLDKCLSDCHAH